MKQARLTAGLTQMKTAELVGVSWMTVLRWESEQRSIRPAHLERLATLFGVPVRWFITIEEGDIIDGGEHEEASESARRIYARLMKTPLEVQLAVEKVINSALHELALIES